MSRDVPSPAPFSEPPSQELPAKLVEVDVARILLQAALMAFIGEQKWTLEHGRAFSLLFPPKTSPGDQKYEVIKVLQRMQQADPAEKASLLAGILERMESAPIDRRIQKRGAQGKGAESPRATT